MPDGRYITASEAEKFLNDFHQHCQRKPELQLNRLRSILDEFSSINSVSAERDRIDAIADREAFAGFLDEFATAESKWQVAERDVASSFNILEAMGVGGDELLHSCVLAWLLSRDIRGAGSHAQGNLGFRLFLEETKLPSEWAQTQYFIARERQGLESRIDVEIACPKVFLIHIENKVWANEGDRQSEREWEDMKRRAVELNVPEGARKAFFLTRTGRRPQPDHSGFLTVSWKAIGELFLRFSKKARARLIQMFAEHYAEAIRRSIHRRDYVKDEHDGEADVQ